MSVSQAEARPRSLCVLLAEDSKFHRVLAVKLLRDQGHRVTVATNGYEVLRALEEGTFDVILMDIEMPILDGLTTTRMIRDRGADGWDRLPIVAVTSNENRDECLEAGMNDYLHKPLQSALLAMTLHRVTQRDAA